MFTHNHAKKRPPRGPRVTERVGCVLMGAREHPAPLCLAVLCGSEALPIPFWGTEGPKSYSCGANLSGVSSPQNSLSSVH